MRRYLIPFFYKVASRRSGLRNVRQTSCRSHMTKLVLAVSSTPSPDRRAPRGVCAPAPRSRPRPLLDLSDDDHECKLCEDIEASELFQRFLHNEDTHGMIP